MLEFLLMPQLQTHPQIIFQQDGALPHFHNDVRRYLNNVLPRRWFGHGCERDMLMPDLTPCDFFLWGYIKEKIYVPPLRNDLGDLERRINTIDAGILRRVWEELEFRIDV
ncbi:hypothetical protein C0J52_27641 [Blattella germanica]|nr:hypothetical protein C0J52_27641 [Blattella germanica]